MSKYEELKPYCHKCKQFMRVYGYQYYDNSKITIWRCPTEGCSSMQVVDDSIIPTKDRVY